MLPFVATFTYLSATTSAYFLIIVALHRYAKSDNHHDIFPSKVFTDKVVDIMDNF